MKPFIITVCAFVLVFTMYALAYLEHVYHGLWWTAPTWIIGTIVFLVSIIGILYACLEMK